VKTTQKKDFQMSRVNGFTLLELLIISALFSVLLIAGIPAMSLWIQYQKSTALQYTLIHSIQFSRAQSVSMQKTITLCPGLDNCTAEWGQNLLVFVDNNSNGFVNSDDQIVKYIELDDAARFLSWRSFRKKPYLQFNPLGLTNSLNGTFHYCPDKIENPYKFAASVAKTGRVRIRQPDC
jgi:type IV fimbrial biogenesis protein FimT|tara:strand:- start:570530 stop:571066 length:537 start_codon:yes stop_codon:yes gene_type:complete